jgi:ribonuclease G
MLGDCFEGLNTPERDLRLFCRQFRKPEWQKAEQMSREIYISSTPHETRLAIVEKDELSEIYYERENEYTLAGSIYNGRVTRVLPGMQSAFVDIGLERDAFLYITDFMEEQGEAADFESGESRGGGRRDKGRGKRDEEGASTDAPEASAEGEGEGRRDRGRNRRGDRPQREAASEEQQGAAASDEDSEGAEGASEGGEGAAPEGSRRWRGRRGRRRGRGGNEESRTAAPTAETQGDVPAEDEAEVSVESQEPRGEGRGRDRGRRGRDGREGRGGNDRGGRSERPARTAYAADETDESQPGTSAEPFILPGESLSKYRRGEEGAASEGASHSTKFQPAALVAAKPSTEAAPILGWDGGLTLPGETLSRHRGSEPARESASGDNEQAAGRDRRRDRDRKRGFGGRDEAPEKPARREIDPAEAVLPAVTSQHEPESTFLPLTDDAPDFEVAETEERIHHEAEEQAHEVEEVLYEAQTDLAPAAEETPEHVLEAVEEFHETVAEYEPGNEASASYRVDPAGPSEFRQNAPLTEEEEIAAVRFDEDHGTAAAAEPEIIHVQSTGEMIAEEPLVPEAEAARNEVLHPASPIEHEGAVFAGEPEEVETASAAGLFAPGDGELEEELLDDDDADPLTLHAAAFEDTEEETLEHAGDLGSMIREMSIDSITRPESVDVDDDEDDFDIDEEEMEEDELEADGEEEAEGFAGSDISEGEEEEFAENGEFEEGEEAVGEVAAAAPARESRPGEERRPRRDGRRGRDGKGRDRRGMANSRTGGRPGRHSVQATDLPAISDLLKPGQEVLVQIAKEPIAKKGARITSHIALPGRFLVFMPTVNHVGVSRKIESDGERRRLKEILLSEKGDASGGFIVRTAASGASEDELRSDLRFLLNLWADIKQRSDSSKSPALIYHDLNLVERVLRDQVSDNFSAIWVDTESEYERVLRFLQRFQPSLIRRVKLYTKEMPLFEQFGITNEINKALRSKVWLKSGGSIVINQTEALVAIDINTGKYVGKTARLEDTIVKTNLDAIPEIVRQIRLRDLGGIIIIDFIDMDERKNRAKVMQALEEELKKDRAPSKVLQFNDFGLVAITRKRVKQSLERTLSTTCGICAGTGMVKSPVTVCNEIYIELRKIQKHLDKGDVMLRVNPEVVKQLKSGNGKWLQEMEEIAGKTILIKSDPTLHPEQFEIH